MITKREVFAFFILLAIVCVVSFLIGDWIQTGVNASPTDTTVNTEGNGTW